MLLDERLKEVPEEPQRRKMQKIKSGMGLRQKQEEDEEEFEDNEYG